MPIRPPQKTTPQGGSPQPFPLYAEHTRVLKQAPDLPPVYLNNGTAPHLASGELGGFLTIFIYF
jgi:hypothetical protein